MLLSLVVACGGDEPASTADVTVVYTSRGEGEIEPCG